MSFLFTFRLPSLPFANPFATGSTTSNEDSEGSSPAVARLQHRNPSLRFGGSTGSDRNTHYSSGPHPFVGNNEEECGNINPRKRTREASFGDNKSTFASSQNVSHYYDNDPTRGSTGRGRDLWVEYDSQIEGGTDGRAGKKRKMGVAETILSTAVSVAIVSTAVGYTAYRLWRDGGVTLSGDTSAQQHDEIAGKGMSNFEDEQEGRRSLTMAGIASPPPPYDATTYEDSWAGYNAQSLRGEASTPASTGIRNSSYKNEPGSSRHPSKLDSPTKRSPNKTFPSRNSAYGSLRTLGSGGRQEA
ncbi:hypothetical protein M408DRAFT_88612 [Serendipita vermifera MAFF 305830]|uniref:Uncharacterized protein n=1 Tax=Serendipita vermifera MAFF 305830 TaxID=933852 RepID=A0A0C3BPF0_SERVB|nr:hypothetical protein M408DRAFT_88612 [Serendipita vermifera MAFF 305830]